MSNIEATPLSGAEATSVSTTGWGLEARQSFGLAWPLIVAQLEAAQPTGSFKDRAAALLFYVLTTIGLFILRRTRPDHPRPYRAIGYPVLPALYIALAASVAGSVNARHAAGVGLDGSTGIAFFTGATAATLATSAAINGSTDAIAASDTAGNLPSGADNAVDMAQLQFVVQTIGTATTTLDGFYQQMVARIGVDTDQASRMTQVQQGVLDAAQARRDGVSGVNLDEEMSDMVRFQKSYNAAARMITTLDEMLETIISRMGVVGR